MSDIRQLLERQSEWQKRRASLSWPEKIHMAEAMRETVLEFQEMRRRLCNPTCVSGNASENPKSTP